MSFGEEIRFEKTVGNREFAGSVETDAGVIDMGELLERNLVRAVGWGLGSAPVAVVGD